MNKNHRHVSIIIINWNGAQDTIECIETVLKNDYYNFNVVIVDNFSDDNSIEQIRFWANGMGQQINTRFPDLVFPLTEKPLQIHELAIKKNIKLYDAIKEQLPQSIPAKSIVLLKNFENSGFASGNNIGLTVSRALFNSKYYFILNNDTVIERDAISKLIKEMEANESIGAATSAIYYYYNPKRIANIGGRITLLGRRKYYKKLSGKKLKIVTFATGCAFMVRHDIFQNIGQFSTNFFFGEEDFEFCWRLKRNKIPIFCVTSSKVYHKIAISAEKFMANGLKKKFLYLFKRIITFKLILSPTIWHLWRFFILISAYMWLILKYKAKSSHAFYFVRKLHLYTNKYNNAKKKTVEKIYKDLIFE